MPTSEQKMLQHSVRQFVQKQYADKFSRSCIDDCHQSFKQNWPMFAKLGWLAACLPEDAGGFGGDAFETALIAEELGRGLAPEPFVAAAVYTAQFVLALSQWGGANAMLQQLAGGERLTILAHEEVGARGDTTYVNTKARSNGQGGYSISGRKTAIIGGPNADQFLVTARMDLENVNDEKMALFLIPANHLNIECQHYMTFDGRGVSDLILEDSTVGSDALICSSSELTQAVQWATDHALIAYSAEVLGAMQASLDITRNYLLTREQYGMALSEFQVLRHRLADMFIAIEQSRSMIYRGVDALRGSDEKYRTKIASATKALVSQNGDFVTAQGIQLHGGIGMAEEYSVGHYYKRLNVYDLMLGTATYHVNKFRELS